MSRRLKLLQYSTALATPPPTSSLASSSSASSSSDVAARRWVRRPEELCVSGMYRSSKLVTDYVAKYKFDDPNWRPLLDLPCSNPVSLELRARHCNISLRHLVQKGHAMYFVIISQHTVLHPRGLAEQSHVSCAIGVRGERLRTNIVHEGPLDSRDRQGARGIVGVSQVEGYGTWFQRKPMLWQRSRRIGALQAHLGAYNWEMLSPRDVGRGAEEEVMLLGPPHTQFLGGGCKTTGIVSSARIAQHPYLYVGEFDAPVITAVEATQQTAYMCAMHNKLVKRGEPLHALAWTTRTPPPYVPLESDLPFELQMSKPQVFEHRSEFPSTVIGTPFHEGAPMLFTEYNTRQGAEHYLYDESPASRPMKWWSQQANVPYTGMMWAVRDGNLDKLTLCDTVANPFDAAERKRPLHRAISANARARSRAARYAKANKKKD